MLEDGGMLGRGSTIGGMNFFLNELSLPEAEGGMGGSRHPPREKTSAQLLEWYLGIQNRVFSFAFWKNWRKIHKKKHELSGVQRREKNSLNLWSPDPYSPPTNLPPIKPCPPPPHSQGAWEPAHCAVVPISPFRKPIICSNPSLFRCLQKFIVPCLLMRQMLRVGLAFFFCVV